MSVTRFSFSQWETYHACPAKWKYRYVDKLPSAPPGPAAARGLDMHKRVEDYITGQISAEELVNGDGKLRFGAKSAAKIDPEYVPVIDSFKNHANGDRHVEHKLGFDSEWYLCGGLSKKAYVIIVMDAVRATDNRLVIAEWKSGQPKETHSDQRKIYALGGLRKWVYVDEVEVTTYYLEGTAPPQRLIVKPTAEEKLKALWDQRFTQMSTDTVLAARPNEGCKWCDYAKSKSGPCAFG